MRGRRSKPWLAAAALGLAAAALGLVSCEKVEGCEYTGTCPSAGAGGVRAEAGTGSEDAGDGSSEGGASGAGAPSTDGGDGGAPEPGACDDGCAEPTPICDEAADVCVECADDGHCSGGTPVCDPEERVCVECADDEHCSGATPRCDPRAKSCIECLRSSDCADPAASRCESGACAACATDTDCAHVAGRNVCDAGACVECTPADESACGANSCHPVNRRCTRTPRESVGLCRGCVADSECTGGTAADPVARCVPMEFAGTRRSTGFCLRRFSKTCGQPFVQMPEPVRSLSDAAAETYCGVNQAVTRCEAVLDLIEARGCAGGADAACGCARDVAGACTGPGQGGLCRVVAGVGESCTYACGRVNDCPAGTTCTLDAPYCH